MNTRVSKLEKLLTVIVVAYNEEDHIAQCIDSILNQSIAYPYDIVVVDDGSTDQTPNILKQYQGSIKIIHTKNQGPSHARNLAVQSLQTPWLAFFDADAVLDHQCLEILFKHVQELEMAETVSFSIGGQQSVSPNAQKVEQNTAAFLQSLSFVSDYLHESETLKKVEHVPSCNVIYSRQSILSLGGFDEKLWPCEDLDLDLRLKKKLGHQVFYCPKAKIFHRRPKTYLDLLKMFHRYGFGHGLLVKKHGLCQRLHFLPFLSVAVLLGLLVIGIQWLNTACLLIAGIFIFNFIFWLLRRKQLKESLLFSCLFITCITVWNLGFGRAMFAQKTRFGHD
ncbi:MAG TPA: glycosyltransferase [Oligoflexia bacterium]|nr:glycosyltransferase [Oligoflexia bacterium]HMR23769.1 glycosyltransferase [Oligoflexia bacterium]